MEAKTAKRDLAQQIVDGAIDAGATPAMISKWSMERGDCELVRSTMIDFDEQDVRVAILQVEDEVRAIGCERLEIEGAS